MLLALALAVSSLHGDIPELRRIHKHLTMNVGQQYVVHLRHAALFWSNDPSVLDASPSDKEVKTVTLTAKKPGKTDLRITHHKKHPYRTDTIIKTVKVTVVEAAPKTSTESSTAASTISP